MSSIVLTCAGSLPSPLTHAPLTHWSVCGSASRVRLSTILPVGCTRRKTARYAASLIFGAPFLGQALPLLVGGQRVVVLQVAERRLRAPERVRRHGRPVAAGIDADLHLVRRRRGHG